MERNYQLQKENGNLSWRQQANCDFLKKSHENININMKQIGLQFLKSYPKTFLDKKLLGKCGKCHRNPVNLLWKNKTLY